MAEPEEQVAGLQERAGKLRVTIQADRLRERAQRAAAVPDEPSVTAGLARSFGQGALFGFADEAEAAMRALWDTAPGEDYSDAYLRLRNDVRGQLDEFRAERPVLALGAEIAGGFAVPGVGVAKGVVGAATTGGRVLRGTAGGAASGALFGAGIAEEREDITREAIRGALFGATAGAAIPAAVAGGRAAFRAGQAALAPERAATQRIGQAISRDQTTPEQISGAIDEAQRLGKPATAADVGGEAVRRELETAVQTPGAAAQTAERVLAPRNRDQLNRLSRDLVRGTGVGAETVQDAIEKTMRVRANAARPVYERAMDFSAELNDDIVDAYGSAIKTPLGKDALKKARRILNVENFDEAPLMERVDALKRGLDDVIGSAKRNGENAIARKALQVKRDLLADVDAVNPDYRKARQIWEDSSGYLDAINRGRDVLKPNFTAAQLASEFGELNAAEKEAFRIGVVDAVVTRMRQQSANEPNLLRIVRSPEMRDKLKAVMTPERAAELDRILDIEESMFRTASQARGGSPTARRAAAQAESEKQLRALRGLEFVTELAITPLRAVFLRGLPAVPRAARERMIAQQNAIIARRLLSSDPDELLNIPEVSAGPPRVAGGSAIPATVIAERRPETPAATQ